MFPWFGTLKATRTMKEKQANAAFQQWREAGIALSYTVQQQWYTLLAKEEQIEIHRSKSSVTEQHQTSHALSV